MTEIVYQQALVDVLFEWEAVCVPRSRPITADMIELYASALADLPATVDELKAARKALILVSTFLPTVAEIAAWIRDHREKRGLEGYVSVLDPRTANTNGFLVGTIVVAAS